MANFCTVCGTRSDDAAGFCHECGTALRSAGVVASVQAAPIPEHPAAAAASSPARRSWFVPAVLGVVALIVAVGGFVWWSSPHAASANASSAVTVADRGPVQPDVAQAARRGRNSGAADADAKGMFAAVKNLVSGVDRKTLDGTYGDSLGVSTYTFKDDGTVLVSAMGNQVEYKYEVDGDTVKLLWPYGGSMVLRMLGNGSLKGIAPGFVLTRRQSGGRGASAGTGAVAAQLSNAKGEARDAVLAEVAKHFLKTSDGWTTAFATSINPPFVPVDHFLRQYRELTPDGVDADEIGAADRLNGFEWIGEVTFRTTPTREAGDPGMAFFDGFLPLVVGGPIVHRPRAQWSQWVDVQPRSQRVFKLKGVWKVERDSIGSMLLEGKLPTEADFQRAGVR